MRRTAIKEELDEKSGFDHEEDTKSTKFII